MQTKVRAAICILKTHLQLQCCETTGSGLHFSYPQRSARGFGHGRGNDCQRAPNNCKVSSPSLRLRRQISLRKCQVVSIDVHHWNHISLLGLMVLILIITTTTIIRMRRKALTPALSFDLSWKGWMNKTISNRACSSYVSIFHSFHGLTCSILPSVAHR